MYICNLFSFSEGGLIVLHDEMAKKFAGHFIASKERFYEMLNRHARDRDERNLVAAKKLIDSGVGFTMPTVALEREYDSSETQYLLRRILRARLLVQGRDWLLGWRGDEPKVIEFTPFASEAMRYVAIGIIYPNNEHSVAILTSIEDALAVLDACGIEGEEQEKYIRLLVAKNFPATRPYSEQVYTWGDMAKVINFTAAAERYAASN